ncbi:MAG TPA: VOC family protein [Bryobacteraceae bacterium]|nr:VOC family protein [Bryobacteraceae bacterium]
MVKLDHLTLFVRDYQAARDWYVDNLGLSTEFETPEHFVAAVQDSEGFTLFLEQSSAQPPNPSCLLYFQVDSVDETYERLRQQGVSFRIAPCRQFWGYGAELADPDGHRVRLWDAASMQTKGE